MTAEQLHVGDHVVDEQSPDATMLVVRLPMQAARCYEIDSDGTTVADVNREYDPVDDVVEVVYPGRDDTDVTDLTTYAFPAGRLERVAAVHDVEATDCDAEEEGRPSMREHALAALGKWAVRKLGLPEEVVDVAAAAASRVRGGDDAA
ncbi:hypothetical protein VB779_08740 [Haloarculaceae archaeon H-GB11]|nr:hypothetical protein [Haloarculaceae archaeon H-GB11]